MHIVVIAMPGSQDNDSRHCVVIGIDADGPIIIPKIDPHTGIETNWRAQVVQYPTMAAANDVRIWCHDFLEDGPNGEQVATWTEEL